MHKYRYHKTIHTDVVISEVATEILREEGVLATEILSQVTILDAREWSTLSPATVYCIQCNQQQLCLGKCLKYFHLIFFGFSFYRKSVWRRDKVEKRERRK